MAFTKEKTKEMFNEFVNAYSDAKSKSYAYFRLIENVELTFTSRVKERYFVDQLMVSVEELKEKRSSIFFKWRKNIVILKAINDFARIVDKLDQDLEEAILKIDVTGNQEESDYIVTESPGLSSLKE